MVWGQVNRQRLKETMHVALSQSVGPGGAKREGFFKFFIRREGEKPQIIGTFIEHHKKTTQGVDQ